MVSTRSATLLFVGLNAALYGASLLLVPGSPNGTPSSDPNAVCLLGAPEPDCPACPVCPSGSSCPACPAALPPSPHGGWDTGVAGLDGVFYFTLPRQPQRAQRMEALLAAAGVRNAVAVRAFDSVEMHNAWDRGDYRWNASDTRLDLKAQGQINIDRPTVRPKSKVPVAQMWKITAQWQTFVAAWRRFAQSGMRTAVFFEDDVDLSRSFVQDLERILRTAPAPWSMLRIGGCSESAWKKVVAPDLYESTGQWCLDGYVLHRDGVQTLLDCADQSVLEWPNPDSRIHNYCQKWKGWRSYSVIPRISGQLNKQDVGVVTHNSTSQWLAGLLAAKKIK